jgi:hypothetical protein
VSGAGHGFLTSNLEVAPIWHPDHVVVAPLAAPEGIIIEPTERIG